jgi:hypothetical protein
MRCEAKKLQESNFLSHEVRPAGLEAMDGFQQKRAKDTGL